MQYRLQGLDITVKGLLAGTGIDFRKERMLRGTPHHLKGHSSGI
jgi:hypothetical protein